MAKALLQAEVVDVVRHAASDHLGRPWGWDDFVDFTDRASHPCGIFRSRVLSVFAKLTTDPGGVAVFEAEWRGLNLLQRSGRVRTPRPVGAGVFAVGESAFVLLSEGAAERYGHRRTSEDWRAVGRALAAVHRVRGDRYGLDRFDGFFGSLPQDNRPIPGASWSEFYAERRLVPRLRDAVDSGYLPRALAGAFDGILGRLPELAGPEPRPTLLHGDPQQKNFLCTDTGAVMIDAAPYFGHPEADLALVDWVDPVPVDLFHGYREEQPIDAGFRRRSALWRLPAQLAAVAVEGHTAFGQGYLERIGDTLRSYR